MIFFELLNDRIKAIGPEFIKLLNLALKNQSHPGDVLLIAMNGFYHPKLEGQKLGSGKPMLPYVIGPGDSGHAQYLHNDFISKYVNDYRSKLPLDEYLKQLVYSPERRAAIDKLTSEEEFSIQMEMLIYVKIWEMTQFLKNMHQLANIIEGKPYNWNFQLNVSGDTLGTETPQKLIREGIRNPLKNYSEPVYDMFKTAYKSQVRNAIAHSDYGCLGRNIHLYNAKPGTYADIGNIAFDEWIEMFHCSLALYNMSTQMNDRISEWYAQMAKMQGNQIQIRITKNDGSEVYANVSHREEFKDWKWAKNLK